jgi:hypothetical protein
MSGSPYSAFSSRFNRLITSRTIGDDAVSLTIKAVELDDTYLRTDNASFVHKSQDEPPTHR